MSLGEHLYKRGQLDEARATVETALRLADHRLALRCAALNALGTLEMRQGRAERARTAYEAALPLARELGEPGRIGGLLGNLAILADESGEVERALDLYEQALTLTVRGQDRRWEGNTRCNLGLLLQACGRSDEAQVQFQQSLAIACELGHAMLEATVLCNLGILLDARDDLAGARAHHERALAVAQRLGDKRGAGQFNGYLGETLARTGAVDEGLVRLADGESALRAVGDEPSLALLLCQRALAEFLAGRDNQAIGRLAALRVSARAEGAADLRRAIDRADRLMTRR